MNTIRNITLPFIATGIIADVITTWWALAHGRHEINPATVQLFAVVGPYVGMIISSAVKVFAICLVSLFVKTDQRLAILYPVCALCCWYAPLHNVL